MGKKIFANSKPNKGLIYRIYKEILQLSNKKKTLKIGKDLNCHFAKGIRQIANKQMKK